MTLTKRQISKLNKAQAFIQDVLDRAALAEKTGSRTKARSGPARSGTKPGASRRTAAQAAKMRADILARRAKGVPAAKLAGKYGVSTAYIYMIKK